MEVNKSDIKKTGDLPPPIPNNVKVEFGSKMGVNESVWGDNIVGGSWGGGGA